MTALKNLEIEITIQSPQSKFLRDFLEKNGEFVSEKNQKDVYYDPPNKTFIFNSPEGKDADEYIRIRYSDKGDSITYKNWHRPDDIPNYADEYESKLSDGSQIELIFKSLGFKETAIIEKTRRTYRFDELLIEFDSIKGLGDFIEIEYSGTKAQSPKEAFQIIDEFLKKVGIKKYKHADTGYVQLMWRKK